MGKPSTVGLGFETPFVDLWTVRDYPDLPGSRIGFRAFSKSLRGHDQTVEHFLLSGHSIRYYLCGHVSSLPGQ
jgi:hypothetical protein